MKIPKSIRDLFYCYGATNQYKKNQLLLEQETISRHAYYVESGCLRMWHNNYGNDVTVKFFIPEDAAASFESFFLEIPSQFGIEAILPSVVKIVSKEFFTEQMQSSSEFKDQMMKISVSCMRDYQNLFLNQIMNNPEDRYRLLMEQDSRLFDIVPHHYIASYLGITPVSLSRLRRKHREQ